MATNEERRAALQAELAKLETEDREDTINAQADDLDLADVLGHLVQHSAGYPTHDDREVHARVIRKHYKRGEYAEDDQPQDQPQDQPPELYQPQDYPGGRPAGQAEQV